MLIVQVEENETIHGKLVQTLKPTKHTASTTNSCLKSLESVKLFELDQIVHRDMELGNILSNFELI